MSGSLCFCSESGKVSLIFRLSSEFEDAAGVCYAKCLYGVALYYNEPCLSKVIEDYKCRAWLQLVYLNQVLLAVDASRDSDQTNHLLCRF